jgi:hypothetical protein
MKKPEGQKSRETVSLTYFFCYWYRYLAIGPSCHLGPLQEHQCWLALSGIPAHQIDVAAPDFGRVAFILQYALLKRPAAGIF